MVTDLFGKEVSEPAALPHGAVKRSGKRREPIPRGHAAQPGTGPEGETCRTCDHLYRRRYSKTYLKCGLMQAHWTGGRGSDVRARDPACRRWEPKKEEK